MKHWEFFLVITALKKTCSSVTLTILMELFTRCHGIIGRADAIIDRNDGVIDDSDAIINSIVGNIDQFLNCLYFRHYGSIIPSNLVNNPSEWSVLTTKMFPFNR